MNKYEKFGLKANEEKELHDAWEWYECEKVQSHSCHLCTTQRTKTELLVAGIALIVLLVIAIMI